MNTYIYARINIINNYKLSSFPEDRINTLVSELNIHYHKINEYIENEINEEKIRVEFIDTLSKLSEISRLAPAKIESNAFSNDYKFAVDILESAIALAQCSTQHPNIRKKIISFGWDMLEKIYGHSLESLIYKSLTYHWLKKRNLITTHYMQSWYGQPHKNDNKIKFEPSESELEDFYQKNKQKLYEYMTFELNHSTKLHDPFSDQHQSDYYHYHKTLESLDA